MGDCENCENCCCENCANYEEIKPEPTDAEIRTEKQLEIAYREENERKERTRNFLIDLKRKTRAEIEKYKIG